MTHLSAFSGLTSVITAAYNCSSSIERTVLSVAAQTCVPLEHIIVNDGSTDQTLSLLLELAKRHSHVKILNQPNLGAGPARNAGIEVAQGRYIAFLDSDDVWLETKLERQLTFMEDEGAMLSFGDYDIVDGDSGRTIGRHRPPEHLSYKQLLTRCPIGCSTAAYNQQVLGKRYMPAIRRGQDWALWLALTRHGIEAQKYPGCEVIYRQTKGSLSAAKIDKAIDMYKIYNREENLGHIRSLLLLARHAINVLSKWPRGRYGEEAVTGSSK